MNSTRRLEAGRSGVTDCATDSGITGGCRVVVFTAGVSHAAAETGMGSWAVTGADPTTTSGVGPGFDGFEVSVSQPEEPHD